MESGYWHGMTRRQRSINTILGGAVGSPAKTDRNDSAAAFRVPFGRKNGD
jgi:hypothetical protein